VFLCASEHEGFCVPIVEAFHKGVPVVAYAATAVPATMDGAGVLYDRKDPAEIARILEAVVSDAALERSIVGTQDAALVRLEGKDFAGTLLAHVGQVLKRPPRRAPEVAFDFWAQFDQFERLEELRQYRPALYRALPSLHHAGAPDSGLGPPPVDTPQTVPDSKPDSPGTEPPAEFRAPSPQPRR
jgi:glycosyltransferase involved in cell wall biosynthesis